MASPAGTLEELLVVLLAEPLAFLFLEEGPAVPLGDAGRERFFGVGTADTVRELRPEPTEAGNATE